MKQGKGDVLKILTMQFQIQESTGKENLRSNIDLNKNNKNNKNTVTERWDFASTNNVLKT